VRASGYVIAATGLAAEARIAARSERVKTVAGGSDGNRLAALLEDALTDGALGIVSFGIAGGLAPNLPSGTIVIGDAVIAGDRYSADRAWTSRLAKALPDAKRGTVIGSDRMVAEPEAKAALHASSRALATDMESHIVARIARDRSLPFAVLRVVADPAGQRLPPAAANGLKPDGTPNLIAVLKSLARDPGQLPDLIRTAAATRCAMSGLLRCHRLLGPGLGFADLG
jgi:hopanoid-associated phosphorylase